MHHLALCPVGRGEVGQVREPAMTDGGLQHLPQGHDFVVKGAACRGAVFRGIDYDGGDLAVGGGACRLPVRRQLADRRRGGSMHPILLHLAGRDLGNAHLAEEGAEMEAKADFVAFDPPGAALPFGDDLVFLEELIGRLIEVFLGAEEAGAVFAAQPKIPVLGDLLGEGEAFLFGAGAALFAADGRRALPEATVAAEIQLEFSSHQLVAGHMAPALIRPCFVESPIKSAVSREFRT